MYNFNFYRHIGSKVIHRIKLIGVSEAIKKHEGSNVEPKGIKTHFSLDESGLITVTGVEYHVEKTLTPEEIAAQESDGQSTFSKLSSTISKLFQGTKLLEYSLWFVFYLFFIFMSTYKIFSR